MCRSLICILFLLSIFKYERVFVQAHRVYNEVYKRDFSEHCRRKVVPSVFLGRKVVEATSEILQFSKLELPYSCSISVRSESGTNIILVIEFSSRNSLISSCTKDADQLLVYEMGETFGGYWGTLGERVMNQDIKNENKYYTIKTTPFSERIDSNIENNNEVIESTVPIERITTPPELSSAKSVDYIEEEVPLVNVSGFLSPGVKHVIDIDSIFDQAYDVSLGSSISYDTTILPLVQFSEMNDFNARRNVDVSNIYSFPMDIKLIYPKTITSRKRKLYRKYKYNSNKLLNFKSNGNAFKSIPTLSNLHRFKNRQQLTTFYQHDYVIKRVHALTSKFLPTRFNTEKSIITRDLIDSILESFNKSSKSSSNEESPTSEDTSELLRKISEMKHNFSVYLSPNLSTSEEKSTVVSSQSDVTRIPTIDNISFYQLSTFSGSEMISLSKFTLPNLIIQNSSQAIGSISPGNLIETYFNDNLDTKSLHPINNETDSTMQVPDSEFINFKAEYNTKENIVVRDTYNYTELPVFNYTQPLRGSLVNRESWENVVQIAPVMADLLNVDNTNKSESMKTNNARRRKKHINSISINMAKPHRKISSKETGITTTGSYNNADMQDFLEMVELQDDEMQGRVALRYLRRYVGPVLFNVCNYEEALARHVYLFNSSRIILAISNFTIDKMALVVTPARTLLKSEDHCSSTQLECQVSGARVCIDSSTACDGTPNCGSYDIYDEDRLICGGATGLQHNVYLAAFTFLAVILTLMYTIYYWLKRCVPKVSDAFFIYTEGYENMLYLDSIMRSPNDDDENSKSMYQPNNAFDADLLCPVIHEESNTKLILKAIRRILVICTCFLYKGKKNDKSEDNIYSSFPKPKRTYSFTEQEIRKMLCNNLIETGIQTGDSLEMAPLKKSINNDEYITDDKYKKSYKLDKTDSLFPLNSSSLNTLVIRTQKNNPDELNVMKFLNNSRSSSLHLQSNTTLKVNTSNISSATPEEKEIQSHVYEQQNRSHGACSTGGVIVTNVDIHEEKASAIQSKHLRFEESATMIPADYYSDSDDRDSLGKNDHRRSVVLGTDKSWKIKRNDNKEEVHEQGSNSNKDYIRFWSKSKKSKKSHK